MNVEIVEYSAFLSLPNLSPEIVEQIQFAARDVLGEIDVTPTALEFDYSGRDASRKIVKFLCRIAPLIGDADGEIECRLNNDDGADVWEFYSIANGRLYRREAKIWKYPKAEVCANGEVMERALHLVERKSQ